MRIFLLLALAACAAHHTGTVVAQQDMKYTANADSGYTPKGHYTCAMESATGTNMKVRVCRYDHDDQASATNRQRTQDEMNQNSLGPTPTRGR